MKYLNYEEVKLVLDALKVELALVPRKSAERSAIAAAIHLMEAEEVKGGELPALPKHGVTTDTHIDGKGHPAFTADQMRAYGEACARAALSAPAAPSEQEAIDAARYRWLRANHDEYIPSKPSESLWGSKGQNYTMKKMIALDAAIDAARK